jgi:hypothetical protein
VIKITYLNYINDKEKSLMNGTKKHVSLRLGDMHYIGAGVIMKCPHASLSCTDSDDVNKGFLTLEDGTDRLFRNVGAKLKLKAA